VLASTVTSIGSINWYLVGEDLVDGFRTRWVGVYSDPNHLAMNLVLVIPIGVAFVAHKGTHWLMRLLCLASVGLAAVAIVFSHSRGGFVGLTVAMGVWALREKRRMQAFVVGALFFLALVIFAPKSFWQRNETVASYQQDVSAMGRVYAWNVASKISLDRPLLGVGVGGFRYAWPLYAPPESHEALVAHNVFLDVIGELGFVGLLAFLIFVGGSVGGAFEAATSLELRWIAGAVAASVTGYLICDLFSGYILSAHLYVLFGLAASARRIAAAEVRTAVPLGVPPHVQAARVPPRAWGGRV